MSGHPLVVSLSNRRSRLSARPSVARHLVWGRSRPCPLLSAFGRKKLPHATADLHFYSAILQIRVQSNRWSADILGVSWGSVGGKTITTSGRAGCCGHALSAPRFAFPTGAGSDRSSFVTGVWFRAVWSDGLGLWRRRTAHRHGDFPAHPGDHQLPSEWR